MTKLDWIKFCLLRRFEISDFLVCTENRRAVENSSIKNIIKPKMFVQVVCPWEFCNFHDMRSSSCSPCWRLSSLWKILSTRKISGLDDDEIIVWTWSDLYQLHFSFKDVAQSRGGENCTKKAISRSRWKISPWSRFLLFSFPLGY